MPTNPDPQLAAVLHVDRPYLYRYVKVVDTAGRRHLLMLSDEVAAGWCLTHGVDCHMDAKAVEALGAAAYEPHSIDWGTFAEQWAPAHNG